MRIGNRHPALRASLIAASLLVAHGGASASDPTPPAALTVPSKQAAIEQALEDADAGDVFALERLEIAGVEPELAAIAKARIAAARLSSHEAIALARPVAQDAKASAAHRSRAWAVLADAAFTAGDYAEAARAAQRWQDVLRERGAPQEDIDDAQRLAALAGAMSAAPRQAVETLAPRTVTTRRDKVGLSRADATVNGRVQDAVLDTGAGLSVVSQSTATKLGLRMLDGAATIGAAAREAVPTRIGIAERFAFAGLELRDVAFLVLDDAQLQLPVPGGYSIDAIIGFPVLREFRRLRFERGGALVPEPGARAATTENLRVVSNALYVDAKVRDVPLALHLDSGGPRSFLTTRFAQRHPHFVDGLPRKDERMAGAGGSTTRVSALMPKAHIDVAGARATLAELPVVVEDGADVQAQNFGLMGGDVLDQFEHWTLDFEAMTFEVGARVAGE